MIIDRYGQVGLARNPFSFEAGESDPDACFVSRGLDDHPSLHTRTLVQVIGQKGFGKTTQVQRWRRQVPGPYHYVAPRLRDRWVVPPVEIVVYADEVDRMPTLLRFRWFRASARLGATLIVGTHRDLGSAARRAGLAVITHHLGPVDRTTLSQIVKQRIANVALPTVSTTFALSELEIEQVHQQSQGSIRQAEHLFHELVAARVDASGKVGS